MGARRQSIFALVVSSFMVLAGIPATAQAASDDVDFDGSGWGHGVGLSQYGALGMASESKGYEDILDHYYQGTSLTAVDPDTALWVNLERNFTQKSLKVLNTDTGSGGMVSINSPAGSATAESGATISLNSLGSDGCGVTVSHPPEPAQEILNESDCSVDFTWYDWSTPGNQPGNKIEIVGCALADWNTPGGTVFRPCQYARGQLHLRHGAGGLDLSAEMLLDDYVLGISEMPYSWLIEALKAQAVAARSYAEGRRITRGLPTAVDDNNCWCHVRDTSTDQRYVGWGHSVVSQWITASNATKSKVLTHPDSGIGVITAFYSSSTGGATEYGHEKGYSSGPVEWLSSVDDHWAVDGTVWNPNASWTKTVSASTVAAAAGLDALTTMKVTATRPGSGSVEEVELKGINDGQEISVKRTGSWVRSTFSLKSEYFDVDYQAPDGFVLHPPGDELLLYKSNGEFRYNSLTAAAPLGATINSGSNYTNNWKAIASLDLDGDRQDEIMFYRDDGLYRYYEVDSAGHVGSPIRAGDEYTHGWDSITAIDLDGDGQDEMFFYRDDGLYRFYDIGSDGRIGSPIRAGDEYTHGWDSIAAVDLDGDGQDEMFFYRDDGLYRFYDIGSDGRIGAPIRAGSEYTKDWTGITAVDLEGDGQDEMFFYRNDGLYRFYDVRADASLGSPMTSGSNFNTGWSIVTTINLDGE